MKKYFSALAALALLFACTPEDDINNGGGNKNNEEYLTVTGEASDITDYSAKLTGYANLPFELGDAEVGIMYDKDQSFESAKKVVAKGLDGDNMFTVTVTGLAPSSTYYYKSYVKNGIAIKYGSVKSFITKFRLNTYSISLLVGNEAKLSISDTDRSVSWSSSDSAIASVDNSGKVTAKAKGKATIKVTANDGSGESASCSVVVCKIDIPQAVDMGTVVNGKNIKWASFNIGASSPEEYGLYYAWGETEPKLDYEWLTYKFRTSGDNSDNVKFSKYNTDSSYGPVDNKTVLDPEDDVAHVKLGGQWRMPTLDEWVELIDKCNWTWTTHNGVNGRLVTASNGNSIFLPATDFWADTISPAPYLNDYGFYWSSSLSTPSFAYNTEISSSFVRYNYNFLSDRCLGQSVRPVSE